MPHRAALASLLLASTACAQATLTLLPATNEGRVIAGLSDDGRVAGALELDGHIRPAVYNTDGSIDLLPLPPGRDDGIAYGFGPDGRVYGRIGQGALIDDRAAVWRSGGEVAYLDAAWSGTGTDQAYGAAGPFAVGDTFTGGDATAIIWLDDGPAPILPAFEFSYTIDFSPNGWVVGAGRRSSDESPRFWVRSPDGGVAAPEPPDDGLLYSASAVNADGLVLGNRSDGVSSSAPFFWSPDRGFDDPIGDPRTNAGMNDMDERLRLVGALHGGFPPRGVLWTRRAGLVLAEDALPPAERERWIIHELAAINPRGQVLAWVSSRDPAAGIDYQPALLTLCPADFNLDARPDTADLMDFLSAFRDRDPYANLHEPATTDVDVHDLLAFLAAFRSGCPN